MSCGLCRCTRPNPACPCCRETEREIETPDEDGGSLLQDLARVLTTCAMFLAFAAVVWFAANKLPTHSIFALCTAGFFAFAAAICRRDYELRD